MRGRRLSEQFGDGALGSFQISSQRSALSDQRSAISRRHRARLRSLSRTRATATSRRPAVAFDAKANTPPPPFSPSTRSGEMSIVFAQLGELTRRASFSDGVGLGVPIGMIPPRERAIRTSQIPGCEAGAKGGAPRSEHIERLLLPRGQGPALRSMRCRLGRWRGLGPAAGGDACSGRGRGGVSVGTESAEQKRVRRQIRVSGARRLRCTACGISTQLFVQDVRKRAAGQHGEGIGNAPRRSSGNLPAKPRRRRLWRRRRTPCKIPTPR